MQIVLDSNILFSALIRDAKTRKIILEYPDFFLFPSFIFIELEKYKEEIIQKSGMKKEDFNGFLHLLLEKVVIIPDEVLFAHKKEALEIVKHIDINDVLFIAAALAYPDSIIWSDDKSGIFHWCFHQWFCREFSQPVENHEETGRPTRAQRAYHPVFDRWWSVFS